MKKKIDFLFSVLMLVILILPVVYLCSVVVSFQDSLMMDRIKNVYFRIKENIVNKGTIFADEVSNNIYSLPEPCLKGSLTLEELLQKRVSVREYSSKALNTKQLGQLLWAAGGKKIDSTTSASRVFPSAGAVYPTKILLVAADIESIPPGVYEYNWESHQIVLREKGDFREQLKQACLGQAVFNAVCTLAIVGIPKEIQLRYGTRGSNLYLPMEVGHMGQNLYLQSTELGLGTVAVGAFDTDKVADILGCDKDEIPLYLFPIGYPNP